MVDDVAESADRIGVVLFNLGGPDGPAAIEPFLRNLFSDPAIIGLPSPFRGWLAWLIARRRAPTAATIYAKLGGRSPLGEQTAAQAAALEVALTARGMTARVVVAMRYWHPRSDAAAQALKAFQPSRIVLLPLYPQFSTTTTASALADWQAAADRVGLAALTRAICCYPEDAGFVAAVAEVLTSALAALPSRPPVRVLFSAHGLPERVVVKKGDPYPRQVEATVAAVCRRVGPGAADAVVCYQSRVGPLKWIGPAIEDELVRAAKDGVAVVVVPIAFVSEHSETLVELDIEYREKAEALGVPQYVRVATVQTHSAFIEGLADQVVAVQSRPAATAPVSGRRWCDIGHGGCPCAIPEAGEGGLRNAG